MGHQLQTVPRGALTATPLGGADQAQDRSWPLDPCGMRLLCRTPAPPATSKVRTSVEVSCSGIIQRFKTGKSCWYSVVFEGGQNAESGAGPPKLQRSSRCMIIII